MRVTAKSFTKADNGKLSKVIEYNTGKKIEIPLNKDGTVRYYVDKPRKKRK